MSATSLWDMCHHRIIWSLMTCLKLYLALAMMPCLVLFVTDFSLWLFYDNKYISDEPLVCNSPSLEKVWLSEPKCCVYCLESEECCSFAEECEQAK